MKSIPANPIVSVENKVEAIVKHCTYMIATGKWSEGAKLPSIRKAESEWSVNRLTVQKAYMNMAEIGLVECRTKAGYFVSGQRLSRQLSKHRYELDHLYGSISGKIVEETRFSPLAVFRYLANLAEIKARELPECAFVECTSIQAECHAREIMQHFDFPVMVLNTDDIEGEKTRIPQHIRVILTTVFHYEELKFLAESPGIDVVTVPIEVSPKLVQEIEVSGGRAILLESEESMARNIAHDAHKLLKEINLDILMTEDFEKLLERLTARTEQTDVNSIILLSPRHWGRVESKWRNHPRVRPVSFSISDSAWPLIADAIGILLNTTV